MATADVSQPDRGLLAILRELERDLHAPPTAADVAQAASIPKEYLEVIERRLEKNRERGFVERDGDRWLLTPAGTTVSG